MASSSSRQEEDILTALVATLPTPTPHAALTAATLTMTRADDGDRAAICIPAFATPLRRALTLWNRNPTWGAAVVGDPGADVLVQGVAHALSFVHDDPAALEDGVAIVLRNGATIAHAVGMQSLGAPGWRAIAAATRRTLVERTFAGDPSLFGFVWEALGDDLREATIRRIVKHPESVARFMGVIGAKSWRTTSPTMRQRLMLTLANAPEEMHGCAPVIAGMDDGEIERLVAMTTSHGQPWQAYRLLEDAGDVGRKRLSAPQRADLDDLAEQSGGESYLGVRLMRAADRGWTRLTSQDRAELLQGAEWNGAVAAALLRAVGAAGWTAMRANEQGVIRRSIRADPPCLFYAPPDLWTALRNDVGALMPMLPPNAHTMWRISGELAAAPPLVRALALACAPWSDADRRGKTDRMPRLLDAWRALTVADRTEMTKRVPRALPIVACAARLQHDPTVIETILDDLIDCAVKQGAERSAIAPFLARCERDGARWRAVMGDSVPSDDMPPDVRNAWRIAVRRGWVGDPCDCARAAESPSSAIRRIRGS